MFTEMKKIYFTLMASMSLTSVFAQQDPTSINLVTDQEKQISVKTGVRFTTDLGYLGSESSPLNSGAKISEARLRTAITYGKYYLYADFDFAGGKVSQRDIFLRYTYKDEDTNFQNIRIGHYAEPFSMNHNTSRAALHFITRPTPAYALGHGRALGLSYIYGNKHVFTNTGIFSENIYNNQEAGNQGFSLGGRYVFYPIKTENQVLHLGGSVRYATYRTGKVNEKTQVLERKIHVSAPLENNVDTTTEFLSMELPWASTNFHYGFEALYHCDKFFARGEYSWVNIGKDRPDEKLFENQLGGVYSWTSLASWQKGNPLDDTKFQGGYLELGYLIKGGAYKYNRNSATLKGLSNKGDFEVVARMSYLDMNDTKSGDTFLKGRNQYYPGGVIKDYPTPSTGIAGGKAASYTLGLNYMFNPHTQFMLGYTLSQLDNPYFTQDKNFNLLQARLIVVF